MKADAHRRPASSLERAIALARPDPCIGYLGHPFEKEAFFSLSGETQPSIEEGKRSHFPEKTPGNGQQTIREGMQRLYERPAIDLFSHELSAGGTWSTSCTLAFVVLL